MVRPFSRGRPALGPTRQKVAAMASDTNRPTGSDPSEKDLSDRLRRLGERLGPPADDRAASRGTPGEVPADTVGLGKAMRLSSEFIAGIIAGALLGWAADRMLGTSPLGMIILVMLGFAAGVMNVMRAAGMLGGKPPGAT
jgi:ATP synthase protein I